jgi:hypothetical protein
MTAELLRLSDGSGERVSTGVPQGDPQLIHRDHTGKWRSGTGERGNIRLRAYARAINTRACVREERSRSSVPMIPRGFFERSLNGLSGDRAGNGGISNRSRRGG